MENLTSPEPQMINEGPQRPEFLKVICILSFIGTGLAFFGAIYSYYSITASAEMPQVINGIEDSDTLGIAGMMVKAVENAVPNLVIGLVSSLLCLFGAIQMWKLKKIGFYYYTIGELASPLSVFMLGGSGLIERTGAIFGLIIAVIWIVLYALNLKHMKV